MIASLIYIVLFPLTRLIGRVSDARVTFIFLLAGLWRTTSCAYINGREVGDVCGAPSRRLPELKTDLLQHCNRTTRIIPGPEDTEREHTCGMAQGQAPPDSEETVGETQRRREDELDEEVMCDDSQPVTEENTSEHKCRSELTEGLEDINDVPLVAIEVELTAPSVDGSQGITTDCAAGVNFIHAVVSSGSLDLTAELHVSDEGTDAPAETDSHMREDDDEEEHPRACYSESEAQFMTSHPVFDLRALLADSHGIQTAEESIGWHFPTGLGLSDLCFCPYVQFPALSYYPAFRDDNNIEVTWRLWEDLSEACGEPCADLFEFSIMSYNILAQDLLEAHPELYTHCQEEMLMWEYRFHLLLRELRAWMPDILCLQEVQENHFQEQMFPVLIEMGYTCIYKRRTGSRTDGCALCYQSERFTQLSVNLLEFYRSDCQLLNRDNVGIVLLLQPITEQGEALSPICVANTHLLFNPRRGDVKLAQLAIVLAEIDKMIKTCESQGRSCEVVLCGDFNALPNSLLLKFITSGELYYLGLPAWMVSGQVDLSSKFHQSRIFEPLWPEKLGINKNCQYVVYSDPRTSGPEKLQYSHDFLHRLQFCQASCVRPPDLDFIPGVTDNTPDLDEIHMFSFRFGHTLFHGLKLTSAYPHTHPITHSCVLTTLNSEGGAMVDYIFYSTPTHDDAHVKVFITFFFTFKRGGGLKLLGRLSLLSEDHLLSLKGLPNETFHSDHLSLLAKFQLS
ncbi:Protein angel -like protein 1 [Triplophysa tibetana]|uniref:Protein angel-like protein 1 n=1 Tax=Triplophysa tibetana TaxID=1572043 RepID=A0A5A9NNA4_9TELE|nr:Protein angel -like protein 1 [Triplophysa tibetana]